MFRSHFDRCVNDKSVPISKTIKARGRDDFFNKKFFSSDLVPFKLLMFACKRLVNLE